MQEVIEEIETIEPSRLMHHQQQRRLPRRTTRSPSQKAATTKGSNCCTVCLLAVITLALLAILGFFLKEHFYHKLGMLGGYIDIARLDLDARNYNRKANLEAGTIIVTARDGTKGIVEDSFFNIMMVILIEFES